MLDRNYIERLGSIAIATRLKNLTDKLMLEGILVYRDMKSEFEPRWFALMNLLNDRGPMSITEIASEINQTHPAIIQLSSTLDQNGMIKSERDEFDSRKRMISLSDKGKRICDEHQRVWQAFRQAVDELLTELDPGFLDKLAHLEQLLQQQSMYNRINGKLSEINTPEQPEIIRYQPAYKEHFFELNKCWLEEYFTLEPYDEFILRHPGSEIIDNGGHVLFMKFNHTVIGTLAIIRKSQTRCELAKMAVKKEFRVKGYGRMLLTAAIRRALCMGFDEMELFTSSLLIAANSLYYSFEFQATQMNEEEKKLYQRLTFKMKMNLLTKINTL